MSDASPTEVLPPEAMGYFQRLLPPSELTTDLGIQIDHYHVLYRFLRGDAVAVVDVRSSSACTTPAGALCIEVVQQSGAGGDVLAADASRALSYAARGAHEAAPWIIVAADGTPAPHRVFGRSHLVLGGVLLAIVAAGVLISIVRRRR